MDEERGCVGTDLDAAAVPEDILQLLAVLSAVSRATSGVED
jgi:hypothetical protein